MDNLQRNWYDIVIKNELDDKSPIHTNINATKSIFALFPHLEEFPLCCIM